MNLFSRLNDLLSTIVGGFTGIWNALGTPVLDLFNQADNTFIQMIGDLVEGLDFFDFFADLTLGGFIFGSTLIFLVVVFIIYMFIP